MPTIANPQLLPRGVPTHGSLIKAVGTRIHEATNRGAFTRALAAGGTADQARAGAPGGPADQPPRARHHGALASPDIAGRACVAADARRASVIRAPGPPRRGRDYCRDQPTRGPHPVPPRGMAQIHRLLANADNSPLYNAAPGRATPGNERRAVRAGARPGRRPRTRIPAQLILTRPPGESPRSVDLACPRAHGTLPICYHPPVPDRQSSPAPRWRVPAPPGAPEPPGPRCGRMSEHEPASNGRYTS